MSAPMFDLVGELPPLPEIEADALAACTTPQGAMPVMFQWYLHVCRLAHQVACLPPLTPGSAPLDHIGSSVTRGLLNRCARLMNSTMKLTHDRECGETSRILARPIGESAIVLRWLCKQDSSEALIRYVSSGLKAELKFKDQIKKEHQARGGDLLVIEARMLATIQRWIDDTGLTEEDIRLAKNLPDVAAMFSAVDHSRTEYVVHQCIGSHFIHGTWVDLLMNYLVKEDDGQYRLKTRKESLPDFSLLMVTAMLVLNAIEDFLSLWHAGPDLPDAILSHLDSIRQGVRCVGSRMQPEDFEVPDGTE